MTELSGWCIFNDSKDVGFTQDQNSFEGIPVILVYKLLKLQFQTDNENISIQTINQQTINQVHTYFNDSNINPNEVVTNVYNRIINIITSETLFTHWLFICELQLMKLKYLLLLLFSF